MTTELKRDWIVSPKICEHSWQLLESHQYKNLSGYGSLEIKIVSRDFYVKSEDDIKHHRPDWFTYVL